MRAYSGHLLKSIRPEKGLRVALDPGHGAAGPLAGMLFSEAGFDVEMVNGEVDGAFPGRSPDPIEDPLTGLKRAVKGRQVGIAYDGDGDRMVVLDEQGHRLSPEQISHIMLSDLLREHKGPVVANVETTRTIDSIAERFGRKVIRVRVGHNYLMEGVARHRACFGVEASGHYSVPFIFPFDDSLAISYYFACILSRRGGKLSSLASAVPALPFERVNIDVPDEGKFGVIKRVEEDIKARYPGASTVDGIRVDLKEGWVLIRASNTQPMIRLTVEADTRQGLERLKREFSGIIDKFINT